MRRLLALPLALALSGCAADVPEAAGPVTATEARTAVERAVQVAAQRTPEAMDDLCPADGCVGLSSAIAFAPERAPGADQSPRVLCSLALPATPSQAGARLLVLAGTDGDRQPYVSQVLVERGTDGVALHEPAFWLGIRYTALQHGRAWSGASDDPAARARDSAAALRACEDTARWVDEVTGA